MTIKGVKAMLNNPKSLTLDDTTKYSVTNQSLKKNQQPIQKNSSSIGPRHRKRGRV